MITKDSELTTRGDCIVAVGLNKGPSEISSKFKEMIQFSDSSITLTMRVDGFRFDVTGSGDPCLNLKHRTDMVVRRSRYVDDRTLMVQSDAAAIDIPRSFVDLLKDEEKTVFLSLTVETSEYCQ